MYTIIGGDGREYGPVSPEQVRQWMAAGRANRETRAKVFGTEEWKQLGDFPDFAAAPPPLAGFHEPWGDAAALPILPLASRISRLCAALLDGAVSALCCIPMFVSIPWRTLATAIQTQDSSALTALPGLAAASATTLSALFVLMVVQLSLLTVRGQTLGKLIMRVRIVRAIDGGRAGFVRAFLLRAVVMGVITWIPYLGFLIALTDYCCIFRDDRRCLHDFLAGTKVVSA